MAAKKRKRAKRKKTANPPKRKRGKKRHAKKNPKRSSARRARRANPSRKRGKRRHAKHGTHAKTHHRARVGNPKRKHGKRRHKRNPAIPGWAIAGLAAAVGLGAFALSTSAAFGLTKRMDPSLASLSRNRIIAGSLFTGAGILLAIFAHPIFGAAVASGGLAALAGTQLSFAIDPIFQLGAKPAKPAAPALVTGPTTKGLGGIYRGGRQQLRGIYSGGRQDFSRTRGGMIGLGGIYRGGQQSFGR